ncbi:MAG: DUF4129 domain-containing protein [Pricia sp.]
MQRQFLLCFFTLGCSVSLHANICIPVISCKAQNAITILTSSQKKDAPFIARKTQTNFVASIFKIQKDATHITRIRSKDTVSTTPNKPKDASAHTPDKQNDSTAITYDTAPLDIKQIKADDLQKYKDDKAFDYEMTEDKITWWDDFTTWLSNIFRRIFEGIFGVQKAAGLLASFLRILPYLLLGVLVFLLIKFFLKVNAQSLLQAKKEQNAVRLSEEEHLIKNEDLQQLVQNALADKNYRLAVRYYYLFLLQLMTAKEIIAWEIQKTNDDYLREIDQADLKQPFSAITRLYEYIWYGDFPIDASKYNTAETAFSNLQKLLNRDG